ncbi:hypothetical protein V8V88_17620 [Paenibacillus phytohabitans]
MRSPKALNLKRVRHYGEHLDFRPLLSPDFLIIAAVRGLKSGDKGGRYRSYSSKFPLRSYSLFVYCLVILYIPLTGGGQQK